MQDKQIDVLDLRGLKCPMPVLKTRKAMQPLQNGTKIWIETTDPLATIDIPTFCNENSHTLIETTDMGEYQRFLVRKGEG